MNEVTLPAGWTPYALATDPDGGVWTTVLEPPSLARLVGGEVVRRHPVAGAKPMLVTVTWDGAVWYTRTDDRLGRLDPDGHETLYELPAGSAPYGLAVAPDGALWFSAPGLDRFGRLDTDGVVHLVDLPVTQARAAMLTVDAGGVVWVALNGAGALAWYAGEKVELVRLADGAAPVGVAAGGDGVWYADIAGGVVGRVFSDRTVEPFTLDDPQSRPHAVAPDPDGGCWVTLWGSNELARVLPDGTRHTWPLPGKEPHGLVVTQRRVWVAMESGSLVAVERV